MRRGALGRTTAALSSLLAGTALVAVGPLVTPASAATTTYTMPATGPVKLTGHGYGHGHGMSQYGAQGAALKGLTWQQITSFYYPGTTRATLARTVRVLISADTSRDVVVAPRSNLRLLATATREVRLLPANGATRWRLTVTAENKTAVDYLLAGTWKRWWTFTGDGAFLAGGRPIRLYYGGTSHQFRGRLYGARPSAGSTDRDTVNLLSLESYLRGVVPAEMPSSWDPDAVASQAVAARSYAAWDLTTPSSATHYDICDTTQCQVYGGYDREAAGSNTAIDATRGVILTHNGTPAFTQFSSSSGGWTSAGSVPYLPAKQDPYDGWKRADGTYGNPNHNWATSIDVLTIEKRWPAVGDLKAIEVISRDGNGEWGGRINKLRLRGTKDGKATLVDNVYGSDFRMKLGLKSTYFTFSGVPTKTT